MTKIVNLQVLDAKNVICVWREGVEDNSKDFRCGIALEDAMGHFMVPRYIVIGTFDDGTRKAAGLQSLNSVNDFSDKDLFLYGEFMYEVNLYDARAFVRCAIEFGDYYDEDAACAGIYKELKSSGVSISKKAEDYLVKMTDEMCIERIKEIRATEIDVLKQDEKEHPILKKWAYDNSEFKIDDILTDGNAVIKVKNIDGHYDGDLHFHYTGLRLDKKDLRPFKRQPRTMLECGKNNPLRKIEVK